MATENRERRDFTERWERNESTDDAPDAGSVHSQLSRIDAALNDAFHGTADANSVDQVSARLYLGEQRE